LHARCAFLLSAAAISGHSLTGFDPNEEAANAAAPDGTTVPTRNDEVMR